MMKILKRSVILGFVLTTSYVVLAGNEDRSGSAGASQLLVNPWARSSAWGSAGSSSVRGLEAQFMNIAGLAYADKTELIFARTNWLGSQSGISMNTFGIAQRLNDNSVISISAMSLNYGDITITNYDNPEGGIGEFSPVSNVIALGYAKLFSERISGGINMKVISEAISSVKSQGIALDAGVRYVTGENDKMKFSITLKNVGPAMNYSGDGLALETVIPTTGLTLTTQQRTQKFELPSQLLIGGSYDFSFGEDHLLTAAGTFVSNAFSKDQFAGGLEYSFISKKATFRLRAGMLYEKGMFNIETTRTALNGPTAGLTFDFPFGKGGTMIGLDYTFRTSNPFGAIHTVGVRINLN
jgi:hypothetical protein